VLATGKELCRVDNAYTVWGELAFSPTPPTLAILMQGAVLVVDARTGKVLHTIDADHVGPQFPAGEHLTLPRDVWYSSDGAHIAIRCGTDTEEPANHTAYLADASSGELLAAIPGHEEGVLGARWLPDGRVVTLDDAARIIRVVHDGEVERTLEIEHEPRSSVEAFAVSDDLATVAIAGSSLTIWRDGKGVGRIGLGRKDDPVLRVELDTGDRVRLIFYRGQVKSFAFPAFATSATRWTILDARTRARDAAIWRIARNQPVSLSAFDSDDPLNVAARRYAEWKLAPYTKYAGPISLDLVQRLISGGFLEDADRLYNAWLDTKTPSQDLHRAASIGYAIVLAHDSYELGNPLLGRLYERFPLDPAIALHYAESISEDNPAKALTVVRKALGANRHDHELWAERMRLEPPAARQSAWADARATLTAEELDRVKLFASGSIPQDPTR
jgi:hypothetical protein